MCWQSCHACLPAAYPIARVPLLTRPVLRLLPACCSAKVSTSSRSRAGSGGSVSSQPSAQQPTPNLAAAAAAAQAGSAGRQPMGRAADWGRGSSAYPRQLHQRQPQQQQQRRAPKKSESFHFGGPSPQRAAHAGLAGAEQPGGSRSNSFDSAPASVPAVAVPTPAPAAGSASSPSTGGAASVGSMGRPSSRPHPPPSDVGGYSDWSSAAAAHMRTPSPGDSASGQQLPDVGTALRVALLAVSAELRAHLGALLRAAGQPRLWGALLALLAASVAIALALFRQLAEVGM